MIKKKGKYVVVEIIERDVMSLSFCKSISAAVKTANALLENRARTVNRYGEFVHDEGASDEWGRASEESPCAWCNWRDNWDAHIIILDQCF